MRAPLGRLVRHDEDLGYLALLVRSGIKPLGRYERPLGQAEHAALRALGLTVGVWQRQTLQQTWVEETVFARRAELVERYRRAFAGRPLGVDFAGARLEGELFGFPPCCVERYLVEPYVANGLDPAVQGMLFHWACPDCQATAQLVPRYRRVLARLRRVTTFPAR